MTAAKLLRHETILAVLTAIALVVLASLSDKFFTAENLLKQRPPFLCNECHSPHSASMPQLTGQSAAPGNVSKDGVNYTQGRGCVNCHTQIHGTNNPARQDQNSGAPTPQFLLR